MSKPEPARMATPEHPQRTMSMTEGKNEVEDTSEAEDLGVEDIQGVANKYTRSQKARKHFKENAGIICG
jgi:hypothetical protein